MLSPEQQARLAAHPARRIGEHLLRERRIASLPEPEDMAGWRKAELARLEVLDTGKPIAEASVVDIDSAADYLEYFGGLAASIAGGPQR